MDHPVSSDQGGRQLYTPEQLQILRAQRQNVVDTIADEMAAKEELEFSDLNMLNTLFPLTSTTNEATAVPSSQTTATSISNSSHTEVVSAKPISTPYRTSRNDPTLRCYWTSCNKCRPPLHERAWLSLNAVVGYIVDPLTTTGLSDEAIEWPPVPYRDFVAKMGLKTPPSPSLAPSPSTRELKHRHRFNRGWYRILSVKLSLLTRTPKSAPV